MESEDTSELIRSFAKNLPKDSELLKLLRNTLKLEEWKNRKQANERKKVSRKTEAKPFKPKQYPSVFKCHMKGDSRRAIVLPLNGEKTIKFDTDVVNDYFDRVEDPGDLQLALLQIKHSEQGGGNKSGEKKEVSDLLNIVKSSPNNGTIKVSFNPTKEVHVGDELEVKLTLDGTGEPFMALLRLGDKES